jgi:hypothetical protein
MTDAADLFGDALQIPVVRKREKDLRTLLGGQFARFALPRYGPPKNL